MLEEQLEQLVHATQYPACARTVTCALRQPAVGGGQRERDDVYAFLVRQVRVGAAPAQQPEAVPQRRPAQLDVERVEAGEKVSGPRERRGPVRGGTVHVVVVPQQVLQDPVDLRQHAVEVAGAHAVGATVDDVGEHEVQRSLAHVVSGARIGSRVHEQLQTLEQLLVVLHLFLLVELAVASIPTERQSSDDAHLAADLAYEDQQRRVAVAIAGVQSLGREAGVESEARDVKHTIAARRPVDDVQERLLAAGAVEKHVHRPLGDATVE